MGIEPTYPSEKYGYIIPVGKEQVSKVSMFKEKPTQEVAKDYIAKGALWNGGVFAFKLGYVLNRAHELIDFVDYEDLFNKYDTLNKISFDYAVVEHEPEIEVMRFAGTWKDLGTWNTLTEAMDSHAVGEALFNEQCENVHVVNELDVPILCMGLKDVVVSASPEGILVSDKEQSSYIKPYVNTLDHRVMFAEKSWGSFKVIDIDKASMTIKVTLNAGHQMNYHSHQHRDEVWTVIAGNGKTIVDGMEQHVKAGDAKIEDAFYRDLAFGTGGLRGVIGAGTNRMNVYTVAKASQGLADYLKKNFAEPSVAIGYDSRIKSDVFAKVAAGVFAANGVKVNIWPTLMPVPTVSFATRYLHTSAGVMITASHNPSKYNGYKVYGADGCQITTEAAAEILTEIEKLDIFADVRTSGFEAGVANGSIRYIPDEVYTAFVEQVKSQSVLFGEEVNKDVAIVYSPLNGTGLKPVTRTLKEMGYTNITVVKEQEQPDGNFPTCPYPNPEIKEAMALGMEYAKKCNADLLLATDPDCDRVGIAVKNKAGEYELLTGNQTGMLLLDYICSQRVKHGKMPADPVMVKTIVTMDMGEQIATHYGLRTINVLTGFKFIGEQIGKLEKQGKADSYVFGFEESYGYLTGSYVRDKDGVDGAYMICEMFSYYATKGISLLDKLEELYKTCGYCLNTLHSYEFDGSAGFAKMQSIMQTFRGGIKEFGGKRVVKLLDYAPGLDGLPKSDVLKFLLEDNCSIVVRPSGTEPKLKTYISISAENKETAEKIEAEICKSAEEYLK